MRAGCRVSMGFLLGVFLGVSAPGMLPIGRSFIDSLSMAIQMHVL